MSGIKHTITQLKLLLTRIPLILKTLILHGIHMSPVSGKQDLRTELITVVIRSFITGDERKTMTETQKNSMRDPGIQGPMWVSKITLPQPELDIRDAVLYAIQELGTGQETLDVPATQTVEAEWTGYRRGVDKKAPQPDISEEERYRELRKDVTSDMTILYLHGGAYLMMDPCTHRVPVATLARLTGAQILSVRYRLAPQNPFPAALVDALTAYLSLIHPPRGSLHEPVPANKIVIAGDSAGGNLTLVLLQTLLTLRRTSRPVTFHGKEVNIELPAGVAGISPWCDVSLSMPSIISYRKFDYMDIRPGGVDEPDYSKPFTPMHFQADDIWPASPPRLDTFCNASIVNHPLVSPMAASSDLWKGAPPVFITVGEESLTDEALILARRVHRAGVSVVAEMFEGKPHCHGLLMLSTPTGKKFFENLSGFCSDAVAGKVTPTGCLTHHGFKLRSTRQIPLEKACEVSDEEVEDRLRRNLNWRVESEKKLQKEWHERARL
ncbi:hypothetical protein N7520_007881 [Penicillium odoratum]|uniref:uncharacterized protein n=1 Tax=Penicillium odoratum TaxID=1167516 RepID=UPI002549B94D|nr:uncharacterized protein N7520_007881 [Penicillium odoratum]KAJ5760725.1 hypothetical protein N7520_007881 [Penicillium odoratum]